MAVPEPEWIWGRLEHTCQPKVYILSFVALASPKQRADADEIVTYLSIV